MKNQKKLEKIENQKNLERIHVLNNRLKELDSISYSRNPTIPERLEYYKLSKELKEILDKIPGEKKEFKKLTNHRQRNRRNHEI